MATAPAAEPSTIPRFTLERFDHAKRGDPFARDVAQGLTGEPKEVPPKYLYDALGSYLFEAICLLPEYYLTRAESEILARSSDDIVSRLAPRAALLELGSGSSVKTRYLIEAMLRRQESLHYLPLDISPSALERSAQELLGSYPDLEVTGFAADYYDALTRIATDGWPGGAVGGRLVLFLGSTIGNLVPDEQRRLLRHIRGVLEPGDSLLLGADLKKDPADLVAAYDDPLGVTAAFDLNLLVRINRELGGRFDVRRFAHRAIYDPELGRIEMHLVSREAQTVRIDGLDLDVAFAAGETIHTESSHKFALDDIAERGHETGFLLDETWLDEKRRFSVNLLRAAEV